jgi:hypothetical protein
MAREVCIAESAITITVSACTLVESGLTYVIF